MQCYLFIPKNRLKSLSHIFCLSLYTVLDALVPLTYIGTHTIAAAILASQPVGITTANNKCQRILYHHLTRKRKEKKKSLGQFENQMKKSTYHDLKKRTY